MPRPTLAEIGLLPLCPTVVGSSAFPGWYAYLQAEIGEHPERFGPADVAEALHDATRLAVMDQVASGIELVTDGEMGRVDFNLGFYDYLAGLRPEPVPRRLGAPAHDQRGTYTCIAPLSAPQGLGTVAEYRRLRELTDRPRKLPVPGPFTLAGRIRGGDVYAGRLAVTDAMVAIVNAELRALVAEGCRFIQLDEPSFACHPDDPGPFIEIVNRTVAGVDAYVSMHMCFGNYRGRAVGHRSYAPLFPILLDVAVDQFALEFASRELSEIGLLRDITQAGKSVAVGLVDVKNLWVEPVDLLAERIHACLRYAPPEMLHIIPDCGFSQTARYAAVQKMRSQSAAVARVRRELGLAAMT
jgi:5-methyltetrahydropteroyltriglutamate--homocysteine methyltransferase